MGKAWISCTTYINIIEQAAKNNGRAVIEVSYGDPLEIMIDVDYAKKEWAEYEKLINKHKEKSNVNN